MILQPLHAVPPPLSNVTFKAAFMQLQADMAAHHNAREIRELAQHADNNEAKRIAGMPNRPLKEDLVPLSLKKCCTCSTYKAQMTSPK